MDIKFTNDFTIELNEILVYISKDSVSRANKFEDKIIVEIKNIIFMPLKHKESPYYNSKNVRQFT